MSSIKQKVSSQTLDVRPQSHNLMKFMNDKNTRLKPQGIKCHPKQTFGVSHDSPQHFKMRNTLIAENGYSYQFDNKKNNNFQYYSQKHFLHLGLEDNQNPRNFSTQFSKTVKRNSSAFHRRKGRLSQFMDKNGWMAQTYKIMGDERSDKARNCSNTDREERIATKNQFLSTQRKSMRSTFTKTKNNPKHKDMIQLIMSEKLKIRKMRNQLATIQSTGENRAAATAPSKFNKTTSSLRLEQNKNHLQDPQLHDIPINFKGKKEDLDMWQRRTCGTKLENPSAMIHRRHFSKQLSNR